MSGGEAVRDLEPVVEGFADWKRSVLEADPERLALEQLRTT